MFLVARGGIEPSTQGFSILRSPAQIFSYQISYQVDGNKKAAQGGFP
jgi:hypothetical protein